MKRTQGDVQQHLWLASSETEPLNIDFIGTTGAGKSTFLSALHRALGYGMAGIRIERDHHRAYFRRESEIRHNSQKGINRSNATYSAPDVLSIYGISGNKIIRFDIHASGSHKKSKTHEKEISATAYALDSSLLERAIKIQNTNAEIDFFPFRLHEGSISRFAYGMSIDSDRQIQFEDQSHSYLTKKRNYVPDELDKQRYRAKRIINRLPIKSQCNYFTLSDLIRELPRAFPYEVFKSDEMGMVIESILDSQETLEGRIKKGIPVIGILTHSKAFSSFDSNQAQDTFNDVLRKYRKYIEEKDYPYEKAVPFRGQEAKPRNETIEQIDFSEIKDWFGVDSLSKERMPIINAGYALAVSALNKKRIDAGDLRLLRFSKRYENDSKTVHYDRLKL